MMKNVNKAPIFFIIIFLLNIYIANEAFLEIPIISKIINFSFNDLKDKIKEVLQDIDIGKNYELIGDDFNATIMPFNNFQTSFFDFSACFEILKEKYNSLSTKLLSILQIDVSKDKEDLSFEDKFQIYDDKKEKLNISDCINTINQCNVEKFFKNLCDIKNRTLNFKENFINLIKNNIVTHSIDSLLDEINEKGKDLIVIENNIKYHITNTFNQIHEKFKNLSSINLGLCENILKSINNIDQNESLFIFKIDYFKKGLLIPLIRYEIYNPITKQVLNLNPCKNQKVNISIPVSINESELFKYDPSSEYYTDRCFPYTSENNTDITLDDRKNEYIENNLTLCENDCEYVDYDSYNKEVICECLVKIDFPLISDINIDIEKLKNNFINLKNIMNIFVVKCYKKLFSKEGLISNIGSYALIFIYCIFFSSSIFFFIKGYYIFYNKINELINFIKSENDKINNINNNNDNDDKKDINVQSKKIKKKKIKNNQLTESEPNRSSFKDIDYVNKKDIINCPPKNKKEKLKKEIKVKFNHDILSKTPKDSSKLGSNIELKNNENSNTLIVSMKDLIVPSKFKKNEIKKEDINNKIDEDLSINFNDSELNTLNYEKALKYDKRTYIQYYWSLLRTKHILLCVIFPSDDYNSITIKFCLFLFLFSLSFTVNCLFFNDSTIHKIYKDQGTFNFIYQLPQILYSTIISTIICFLIKKISLTEKDILAIKNEKIDDNFLIKVNKTIKCLKIKFYLFFIIFFLFLFLFWYYLSCFCSVYRNSQFHLIKDTIFSFGLSLIYPFGINLLPGIFRIPSLRNNNHKYIYYISKLIQLI